MPLISICIPAYNEEGSVALAYERVTKVFDGLPEYDLEIVVTDNHSSDRTFAILSELAAKDPRLKVARFSRNVGYQRSIYSAYMIATGDAVVQLDCDLQDPPELIPEMLQKWRDGADVVFGIRKTRREGLLITATRKIFYRLIDYLSEDRLPHDAGDFRLVSRNVVEALRQLDDKSPYLRGMITVLGFRQQGFLYDRDARVAGETKFKFGALTKLAVDAVVSHSTIPLQISSYLGIVAAVVAAVVAVGFVVARLAGGSDWPAGFTTLVILLLANMSLTALLFGIVGTYLARVLKQVRGYPMAVVQHSLNLSQIQSGDYARVVDVTHLSNRDSNNGQ
jgi:glycosyltransferase involved in cell wall biosynthesis